MVYSGEVVGWLGRGNPTTAWLTECSGPSGSRTPLCIPASLGLKGQEDPFPEFKASLPRVMFKTVWKVQWKDALFFRFLT